MPKTPEWYQSHQTLVEVAYFLVVDEGMTSARDLLDFFEKPYHYPEHWERYLAAREAEEKAAGMTDEEWTQNVLLHNIPPSREGGA